MASMTTSTIPSETARVWALRPGRLKSCFRLPLTDWGRLMIACPRALRLKHQFQSMDRKKMATPSRATRSSCHSTV